ncbi:extracellular solute-binding protein [Nocardiopsis trehalosi]|uniref:extracellular solute-binding protein n=1 Tax=Nocardiopsis trehalosi TaxID=109329 RepID=UPI0008359860|nr:extracellular solute-binding protein [Nocardiopsis trehalosi]
MADPTGPRGVRWSGTTPRWRLGAVAGAAALVLALGAVALGAAADGPAGTPDEFTVVTGLDASGTDVYRHLVDEWNACRSTGPTARLVEISAITDLQRADMVRWLQTEGHRYDVLNLDNQWIAEFARAGHLARVDGAVPTGGLLPNVVDAVRYDDEVWAVPFVADAGLLYYRSDLVDRADLEGQDWADTLAVLDARAEGDGVHGYAAQLDAYEGLTVNTMEFANEHTDLVTEADGTPTAVLADDPQRTQVRVLTDALASGAVHPGSLGDAEADSVDRFAAGEAVAMRNWPIWYDRLAERPGVRPAAGEDHTGTGEDPEGDRIEFDVLPLPSFSAVLGGQSLAVNRASPYEEAAFDLIAFLTATEQQRRLFHTAGYAPVRADAYHGEVVDRPGPDPCDPDGAATTTVDTRRGAYADLLLDSVTQAGHRPRTPYYQRFTTTLYGGLHPLLDAAAQGRDVPRDDLADLQERLNTTLGGG